MMPTKPKTHGQTTGPKQENRESACKRGYDRRWRHYAKCFLLQPENVLCAVPGCNQPATVADHIIPHRGNVELFWAAENHQGMCRKHHSEKTGRGE